MMRLLLLVFSFLQVSGKKVSVEENDAIQKECKSIHTSRVKRVLYGQKLSNEEMSYVVNVQIGRDQGSSRCSGTIISPYHILTAGHCFYDKTYCNKTRDSTKLFPRKPAYVHFGGNCIKLAASGSCAGGVLNRITKAVKVSFPVRFSDSGCNEGDIALVEVKEKFPIELGFA